MTTTYAFAVYIIVALGQAEIEETFGGFKTREDCEWLREIVAAEAAGDPKRIVSGCKIVAPRWRRYRVRAVRDHR